MEVGGSSESPSETKKSKSKTARKPKDAQLLKQKSPAEFFADNKNIAGFDNPGKCLYTTVRELVENALDSAESISELPIIEITIEEIGKSKYNSMIGLADHDRVDAELYDDFETAKAREKRLAREARLQEAQAKNAALGKKGKAPTATKPVKSRETSYYRVHCKDNGRGMQHDDIPNMFGRVLSGTKYGLKQTRGKYGLGAKMALIWSKMSTGLPIEILSSMKGQSFSSFCRLDIDIHKNIPHIHVHEKRKNEESWHGAEIQIVIEGNWTTYRSKILHYMRQMAVITPYSQFLFKFLSESPDKNVTVKFARRTDIMPPAPLETKYHPSAVDLLLIKRLITETSKQNLLQFLQHEFVNVGKAHAERLIGEMGPDFSPKMSVKSLTSQQIVRIHQLFRQAKFDDPSGDCLSPAGEYNLRLGIIKELHPDMVATYSGSAQVFEGHPFIVEAGLSLGGKDVKQESARGAVEIAKKFFPDVECKWGEAGLSEIIEDASIIGVAVVLAGQTQVDMSLRLLKAGKHVLQEKPAAASVAELETAISSYTSFNPAPIWAVAENYRFEPAFVEGKKLMAEIGDIINIHVIIEGSMNSSNPYFSSSWRRDFFGGFILDMGVHFISGLRMLVGCEVASVSAITSHVDSTLPPPDHISSTIQLENGSSGVFVMVVSSRSPKVLWRIVGLKGTLQVERGSKDGKHGYTVVLFTADGQTKSWFYPFSGVTEELKTFLSDISLATLKKDGSFQVEPRLSFLEGARDVAVLDAMLESGKRKGAPVQVKKF